MRYIKIDLSLWKWEGVVLSGGTPEKFAAFAKSYIDANIEPDSNSMGHAFVGCGKPWMLWCSDVKDVATLAHEAFHITAGVLEARGLKHSDGSEEAYTYTMEAIIRAVVSAKPRQWRVANGK